ncbi:hypothetical protein DV736_g482, partial [Chaetothyriales sp. CBS 134916]
MEIHRASASAVHIPDHGHHHHQALDTRPNTTSRSSSHTSLTSSHSRDPMAIPGVRTEQPPPPLPPPRYNEELDRGVDAAWTWQNRSPYGDGHISLAPVKPSSSLYGGYMQPQGRTQLYSEPDEMNLDDWDGRSSAVLAFRAPSHINIHLGVGNGNGSIPGLVRRPPSPTPSSQRLHGERPLAQQNFDRSSQAYDQQLLSKIGKPNSPPRHSRSDSADSTHLSRKLSLQTRDSTQSQRVTVADLAAVASDPVSRWVASPGSGALSPCARPNWRDYVDHRSPSNDSTPPSLLLDPELFVHARTSGKPSRTGSKPGNDDYYSPTGVSQRGSYDTAISTDLDQDFPGEEGAASRKFHLNAHRHHSGRKPSRQGMKRRAPSPPAEVARDDKPRVYPTDPCQILTGATLSRSPATQNQSLPGYGSVSSSTASSFRLHSYPSSFAPSLTGSSLTSISSLEKQSPPDPAQLPFITSTHLVASPVNSVMPSRRTPTQQSPPDPMAASRKMSIQSAVNDTTPPTAPRTGAHFMCDCCPKKPRKFGTEEELRAHQMEKQYSCQYCNNRFKNKNEAERHQNSLHLRRHSWSCAAIPSYHTAFHPASSVNGPAPTTPLSDACGFCGEEFPNHPQPDWECRIAHLTNVHKFGECNQAKKFYRADHFRQHLKHSHAGQSGKWTNILESVCLREEQPAEVVGMSPAERDGGPHRSHHIDAVQRGAAPAAEGYNDP